MFISLLLIILLVRISILLVRHSRLIRKNLGNRTNKSNKNNRPPNHQKPRINAQQVQAENHLKKQIEHKVNNKPQPTNNKNNQNKTKLHLPANKEI